jgi:2-polyprenyl-3-methyl-5-hydroxy-6-metoxy-1,4-benzoquinol methylase
VNFEQHHPLQPYWNLAVAGVHAEALDVALEAGLFDLLQERTDSLKIASVLDWQPRQTELMLELLWSMGLLERQSPLPGAVGALPMYRVAAALTAYLQRASHQYCGDALAYRLHSLRHFGTQLPGLLHGRAQAPAAQPAAVAAGHLPSASGAGWADAARRQIGQEQRAATAAAALSIVRGIPEFARLFATRSATADSSTRDPAGLRLLDLGGGPGWIAIELARACAQVQGAVFDWPETVAVAHENIAQAGLATRLHALPGDLATDDIGTGYDLIWCSSVLHFVGDMPQALLRMHAALADGGVLACAQAEVPEDAAAAARVLPYYLPMRMQGRHVTQQGGLAQLLARAGFSGIEQSSCHAFPMAPVQVLIARKAAR